VVDHGLGITRAPSTSELPSQPGHVRVTASTGDLTVADLTVASLEAHASRGSITASFTRPPDRILARLDAGSARLTVPATTYAVDATTPSHAGHVTVDVPTDPASPRTISAHISRGDIHILRR
jgi:hypothetical protein